MNQTARLANDGCTIIVETSTSDGTLTSTFDFPDKASASAGFRKALEDAQASVDRFDRTGNTVNYRKCPTEFGALYAMRQNGPPRWLLPRVRISVAPSRVELHAGWLETGFAVGWVRRS